MLEEVLAMLKEVLAMLEEVLAMLEDVLAPTPVRRGAIGGSAGEAPGKRQGIAREAPGKCQGSARKRRSQGSHRGSAREVLESIGEVLGSGRERERKRERERARIHPSSRDSYHLWWPYEY